METSRRGPAASGTPLISFYSVDEILKLAEETGLRKIQTVSTKEMEERYFKNTADNLVPASGEFLRLKEL